MVGLPRSGLSECFSTWDFSSLLYSNFCLLTLQRPHSTISQRFCTLLKVQYMLWNGEQVLLLGQMMQEWRFMILPMTSVLHLLKNHEEAHAPSFYFLTWSGRLVKWFRHAVELSHSFHAVSLYCYNWRLILWHCNLNCGKTIISYVPLYLLIKLWSLMPSITCRMIPSWLLDGEHLSKLLQ